MGWVQPRGGCRQIGRRTALCIGIKQTSLKHGAAFLDRDQPQRRMGNLADIKLMAEGVFDLAAKAIAVIEATPIKWRKAFLAQIILQTQLPVLDL
jgi:hypothetical protein